MKQFLRLGLITWLCGFAVASSVCAQGLTVQKIEISHIGPPAVSDELVRSYIRVREGDSYRAINVDDDVRSLYDTGFFYHIRVSDEITPEGVILTYILQGKPRLTTIRFEGNKKFSNTKLRKTISSKEGEPLDEPKLFADSMAIQKLYQTKGYPRTEVTAVPSIDEEAGRGTATFQIKEGRKIRIERVEFEGAVAIKPKKLRKAIKTKKYWLFSWLLGTGVFKDEQFEDDQERLREYYWNEGYIDFELKDVQIDQPSDRRMVIRFVINEGRQYKVGSISLKGDRLFTDEEIVEGLRWMHNYQGRKGSVGMNGFEMDVGDTFTPAGYQKDIQAIEDFYGSKGYIDVKQDKGNLRVRRIPNTETGTMDIEFQIDAGEKAYIEKIDIRGNATTKDRVLRREMAVAPGEVFDMVKVRLSQRRLENLQYFEKVDVQPEDTEIPNRKNLSVAVEEKSTGSLTFGAGFSTVDSIVGFAEMNQGNFDLFNPPTFRGGGQKFRLRVQLGTRRQDYLMSFVEPWFLGRKLALGVELFHRELDFQSDQNLYDETRTGGQLSLTRALGSDFLIGSISYRLEQVGIIDVKGGPSLGVDPSTDPPVLGRPNPGIVPRAIREEEGKSLISRMGLTLAYDTRNTTTLPDRGQRTQISGELAGGPFGGERDFYKLELESAWYFKGLFSGHVLELVGRGGVVDNYGDSSSVPFYERYYLGGISSLRGFDYRGVSPREPGYIEPVGGGTVWFGSAEYSVPIIERLRLAVFYDIGNVMADAYDFDFSEYNDNWGVGIRLNLPIGPLRLDYGIPINTDEFNGSSGKFQFSVGYQRPL